MKAIRPLAEEGDTVLLRRADYEALLRRAEDAGDAAQIREVEARIAAGEDEYVPVALTKRLMAGGPGGGLARAPRPERSRACGSCRDLDRLSQPDRDRQEARPSTPWPSWPGRSGWT